MPIGVELARQGSQDSQGIVELLGHQDVERRGGPEGWGKPGPHGTRPGMRHASNASTDIRTTAVDICPAMGDNTGVLELVEQSEENTGIAVEETIGDAAYGDGGTRQAFADAGRTLIAKVPE